MNRVYFTKIRSKRLSLGLEVIDVAKHLGVSKETYRTKEINPDKFTAKEIKKLLELFGMKFEELFY